LQWVWLGTVPYRDAWALQRALAAARAAGGIGDCLLLLEHPPVYTAGRNTEPGHLCGPPDRLSALGADVIEVDRGGSVTFHGPGQMVGYPILKLDEVLPIPGTPQRGDVIRYVRALEDALQATAARFGVRCGARPPYTGVWAGDRKLAAIGVKLAAGGITTHGVALNVSTDLSWFDHIVPCGIPGLGVGSLAGEGAPAPLVEDVATAFAPELAGTLHRSVTPAQRDVLKFVENGRLQPIPARS
jgi:lipoyl(octanoyl) transferase